MCVGCRERAGLSELLRVVWQDGTAVPDPHRRLPGRGAHVHPVVACLDRAERSRALQRALRAASIPDLRVVRDLIESKAAAPSRAVAHEAPDR